MLNPSARTLRWLRLTVNQFWFYIVVAFLLQMLRTVFRLSDQVMIVLSAPFAIAMVFGAIPWFVNASLFLFGLINCPQCHKAYCPYIGGFYVSRRCGKCGFDIVTEARKKSQKTGAM